VLILIKSDAYKPIEFTSILKICIVGPIKRISPIKINASTTLILLNRWIPLSNPRYTLVPKINTQIINTIIFTVKSYCAGIPNTSRIISESTGAPIPRDVEIEPTIPNTTRISTMCPSHPSDFL